MRKCSSTILYAACTFRPYKSTPVLKLFRTLTGKMTRGLSLRMVFSLLFQDTLLSGRKERTAYSPYKEKTAMTLLGKSNITKETKGKNRKKDVWLIGRLHIEGRLNEGPSYYTLTLTTM